LAAGVILTSLIIASVFLPLLSRKNKMAVSTSKISPEQVALIKLMKAVIKAMKEETNSENRAAALSIISDCHRTIWQITHREMGNILESRDKSSESKIWVTALDAEKKEIQAVYEEGLIDRETLNRLLESANHREMILTKKYKYKFILFIYLLKRALSAVRKKNTQLESQSDSDSMIKIRIRIAKAAVDAVTKNMHSNNNELSLYVLSQYNEVIQKFYASTESLKSGYKEVSKKRELQYKAIQIQRNEVQILFEKGEISLETANKLRRLINYSEASMIQENEIMEA